MRRPIVAQKLGLFLPFATSQKVKWLPRQCGGKKPANVQPENIATHQMSDFMSKQRCQFVVRQPLFKILRKDDLPSP
jgi:hypothetical protein